MAFVMQISFNFGLLHLSLGISFRCQRVECCRRKKGRKGGWWTHWL